MDYVYICRSGDNEELRYSLRSTMENLPEANVWVVGDPPDWYTGNKILVKQLPKAKYRNAVTNLKTICTSSKIKNSFVLMNDDFFTVQKIDEIPNYNGGLLRDRVETYTRLAPYSEYTKRLNATYRYLIKRGIKDPLDYELHVPMTMDKSGLSKSIYPHVLWRSIYGNQFKEAGISINDVKVYNSNNLVDKHYDLRKTNLPFLSSEDRSFEILKEDILDTMFPNPSPLELPGFVYSQKSETFSTTNKTKKPVLNSKLKTKIDYSVPAQCGCFCNCCQQDHH